MDNQAWRRRFDILLSLFDMTDGELMDTAERLQSSLEQHGSLTEGESICLDVVQKLIDDRIGADMLIAEQIAAGDYSHLG